MAWRGQRPGDGAAIAGRRADAAGGRPGRWRRAASFACSGPSRRARPCSPARPSSSPSATGSRSTRRASSTFAREQRARRRPCRLDADARARSTSISAAPCRWSTSSCASTSGTHVAPVRLQGRVRVDEPWRELGSGVFYRLERGGDVATSPAIALPVDGPLPAPGSGRARRAARPASTRAWSSMRRWRRSSSRRRASRRFASSPARATPPPARCRSATVVPQLDSERAALRPAPRSARSWPTRRPRVPPSRRRARRAFGPGCSGAC